MADILIYRMKMPTDEPLRIVLNPNGQLFVDHGVTFTEYEAIELPGHGDLIDRDAFREDMSAWLNWCSKMWITPTEIDVWEKLMETLDIAPAIVPSNKEESE